MIPLPCVLECSSIGAIVLLSVVVSSPRSAGMPRFATDFGLWAAIPAACFAADPGQIWPIRV